MTKDKTTKDMADSVNEREIVLDILLELNRPEAMSHLVIGAALKKYQYLLKHQRSFITRLAQGTLERRIELDYIINQYSKTPVRKMKPLIRSLLEMSVYQLKYMDNVPVSAVCNEAVKLAGKRHFVNLKGFVNGVLRNIARNDCACEYPDQKKEPVKYLSVRYSMPEELVTFFKKQYDDTTLESILAGFYKEKATYIRCNTKRLTVEELKAHLLSENIQAEAVEGLPYALKITGYDYLLACESFQRGEFFVQDISSMLAGELASPAPNDRVIDVCAAPGGKALHVAEKLRGTGSVEARDLSLYKVGLITENIERSGLTNIHAVQKDATVCDADVKDAADLVIADLPCSGLGVLAKKTDLKYKATEQSTKELAGLQREILKNAASYVRPGGTLIYSTCTINPAENIENVHWFLKEFPEFVLDPIADRLCSTLQDSVEEAGCLQLLPGIHKSDGFFIARFGKK